MINTLKNILNINKILKIVLIFLIYIFCIYNILRVFVADIYFQKAGKQLEEIHLDEAFKLNSKAISLNSKEPQYYIQQAKILMLNTANEKSGAYIPTKNLIYTYLTKALYLNPNDLVSKLDILPVYALLSTKNILDSEIYPNNIDDKYEDSMYLFIENLKKDYPNDVGVIAKCAYYEKRFGFDTEYQQSIERIKILRPDILEWYPTLLN